MINCALIGFGYWGPNIARTTAKLKNVNLVAICDQDENKLKEAKALYPQAQLIRDYAKVLNDPGIDAVLIATPANTHFKFASAALQKNKHVLIEKPLTTNVKDALKLKALHKKHKKIIMVGHTFEFNPAIRKAKEIIDQGTLGDIYYIYSTRVNLGQVRGDVNALWNLAPHDISIANYLLGSQPIAAMAIGASFLQKGVEDIVFAGLKYPKNILVGMHVNWLNPAKKRELTVVGSKKMLAFDDLDNEMPLKIYDKRADHADVAKGLNGEYKIKLHSGDVYAPQIEGREPLGEELKHFFESIEKNQKPHTDIENGIRVVAALEACQNSLKKDNLWIKI